MDKPLKKWHVYLLLLIVVVSIGFNIYNRFSYNKASVSIASRTLKVLMADTDEKRFKGLSDRADLGEYDGMLFVFTVDSKHVFVMRDMRFAIDIIWLNKGVVVDIAPNAQPEPGVEEKDLTLYMPSKDADAVLEVPAGFAVQNGLKIGDKAQVKY